MRLRRRRGGDAVATYAAILDGVHLWIDLDGPLAVRDTGSGATSELGVPPHDLSGLATATYDVLAGDTPVRLAAAPERPLVRTPLAPDGVTQWQLVRHDDGRLQLTGRLVPATAELDAVDLRGDRVHLRIRPPGEVEPGCHLLLLDTEDQLLESLPATGHDGLLETVLGVDDLPAGYFGVLRLAVGTEADWVRVRRRGNDLADPNHAVLLPELSDEVGRLRARLRWNPDGLLALRSIDPDEVAGA
jgi:hypothetical protein